MKAGDGVATEAVADVEAAGIWAPACRSCSSRWAAFSMELDMVNQLKEPVW